MDVNFVITNGSCENSDRKLVLAPVVSSIGNEYFIVGRNACCGDDEDLVRKFWVNVPVRILIITKSYMLRESKHAGCTNKQPPH